MHHCVDDFAPCVLFDVVPSIGIVQVFWFDNTKKGKILLAFVSILR